MPERDLKRRREDPDATPIYDYSSEPTCSITANKPVEKHRRKMQKDLDEAIVGLEKLRTAYKQMDECIQYLSALVEIPANSNNKSVTICHEHLKGKLSQAEKEMEKLLDALNECQEYVNYLTRIVYHATKN